MSLADNLGIPYLLIYMIVLFRNCWPSDGESSSSKLDPSLKPWHPPCHNSEARGGGHLSSSHPGQHSYHQTYHQREGGGGGRKFDAQHHGLFEGHELHLRHRGFHRGYSEIHGVHSGEYGISQGYAGFHRYQPYEDRNCYRKRDYHTHSHQYFYERY